MDSVLGRKQRIKNSDWIETFDKIEQLMFISMTTLLKIRKRS